jgi:hypothetical protein
MSRTLIFLAGRRPLTVPRVFNQAVCAVQQEPSRRIQTSAAAAVNAGTFPHLGSDDRRLAFAGAEVRVRGIRDLSEPAGNRVTVSPQGQVFVNFPFWSDDHTLSVAVKALTASRNLSPMRLGTPRVVRPKTAGFAFRAWSLMTKGRFGFWIQPHRRPKAWSKAGRSSSRLIFRPTKSCRRFRSMTPSHPRSYLNDVRTGTKSGHAFITESGTEQLWSSI